MDAFGVGNVAAYVLVDIIERRSESPAKRAAARAELVRRNACQDCGAPAGRECKPEYGCENSSRLPRLNPARCPVCGGLMPGDVTHTRC